MMRRRSRFHFSDLAAEAGNALLVRSGRSALTALGTILGVGAFVTTLGLTTTAGAQIGEQFNALEATEVVLQDTRPGASGPAFPADTQQRLERLNGVVNAGLTWTVQEAAEASALPPAEIDEQKTTVPLLALSPGALRAMDPTVYGRLFDETQDSREERVVVIGAAAAQRLGVAYSADHPVAIFIDGQSFTVLGVLRNVARRPEALLSVAVPARTARAMWGGAGFGTANVLIQTRLGAAQLVGRQAPIALLPQDPSRLLAIVPPDPKSLRRGVEADFGALVLLVGVILLAVGAINIANTTLVSVLERVPEIGLRRALGATRRHVALQFLAESALLGTGGGVLGTAAGIVAVVSVSAVRQWTPVVDPVMLLVAPLLGTITGLAAGLYPSLRAGRVEPVEALRR